MKPIFVIRIPTSIDLSHAEAAIAEVDAKLESDYHTLYVTSKLEDITFELFSVNDVDEAEFNNFKEYIKEQFKTNSNEGNNILEG